MSGRSSTSRDQNGGTKDFNGTINDGDDADGSGVSLTNNTGATVRFDGGLTLSTTTDNAFTATGGGTVVVTDPNAAGTAPDNTLTTTTGTALNVANTNIGAGGLNFKSIAANGATNGIIVNNTGSSGGLTVSGVGTTAGTGGTIQSTTKSGARFVTTNNVALSNMNFTNDATTQDVAGASVGCAVEPAHRQRIPRASRPSTWRGVNGATLTNLSVTGSGQIGINGNNVIGLALANSTVTGNGNEAAENGLTFQNLTGTSSISNTTIRNNAARQVQVTNIQKRLEPDPRDHRDPDPGRLSDDGHEHDDDRQQRRPGPTPLQGILFESAVGTGDQHGAQRQRGGLQHQRHRAAPAPQSTSSRTRPAAHSAERPRTAPSTRTPSASASVPRTASGGSYNVLNNEFNRSA